MRWVLVACLFLAGCGLNESDRRLLEKLKPEPVDYKKLAEEVRKVPVEVNVDVDAEKIRDALQGPQKDAGEGQGLTGALVHLDSRVGLNGASERLKRDLERLASDPKLGWTVGVTEGAAWQIVTDEPGDTPLPYVEFFRDGELCHTSVGYSGAPAAGYEGPISELTKWHPTAMPRRAVKRRGSIEYLGPQTSAPVLIPKYTCVDGVCYQNW